MSARSSANTLSINSVVGSPSLTFPPTPGSVHPALSTAAISASGGSAFVVLVQTASESSRGLRRMENARDVSQVRDRQPCGSAGRDEVAGTGAGQKSGPGFGPGFDRKRCSGDSRRIGEGSMKPATGAAFDGARGRNRTVTALSNLGILSPVRLPVSPPGRWFTNHDGIDVLRLCDFPAYAECRRRKIITLWKVLTNESGGLPISEEVDCGKRRPGPITPSSHV